MATEKLLNKVKPLLEVSQSSSKVASAKGAIVKEQSVKSSKRDTKKLVNENYYAADIEPKSVADKLTNP